MTSTRGARRSPPYLPRDRDGDDWSRDATATPSLAGAPRSVHHHREAGHHSLFVVEPGHREGLPPPTLLPSLLRSVPFELHELERPSSASHAQLLCRSCQWAVLPDVTHASLQSRAGMTQAILRSQQAAELSELAPPAPCTGLSHHTGRRFGGPRGLPLPVPPWWL